MSGIWTNDHWTLFRCSNRLRYQTTSSTLTQTQLCSTTPISSLCSVFMFHFGYCLLFTFKQNLAQVITLVTKCIDTYGIHHWRIFRSSYTKLAWVGFEPTITELCSDALTDWGIKPRVQLSLRPNFVQLLQFHLFVQCSRFSSAIVFVSRHIYFKRNVAQVIVVFSMFCIWEP